MNRVRVSDQSLTRRQPRSAQERQGTHQDPELLRRLLRAKDRMDAVSHEDWPVARLARVSGVSEAHFARSFKEAFGVPPHRYLLTRRLERATALLRDTNLAITEIAFELAGIAKEHSGARSEMSLERAPVSSVRVRRPLRTTRWISRSVRQWVENDRGAAGSGMSASCLTMGPAATQAERLTQVHPGRRRTHAWPHRIAWQNHTRIGEVGDAIFLAGLPGYVSNR
jgi:AraC-like DNA-binding protein